LQQNLRNKPSIPRATKQGHQKDIKDKKKQEILGVGK
jgi:hypothetical protein